MTKSLVLVQGVVVAGCVALVGCDKGVDLGPAGDSGGLAGGSGDGSESGSESGSHPSDSATSTSDGTTPTEASSGSSGDALDVTGAYIISESEQGWPAFHILVADGETGLEYTFSDAFFDSETEMWTISESSSVTVDGIALDGETLQGKGEGVLLDGVPGTVSLDMVVNGAVLCGGMGYGYQDPLTEVSAWGFKLDEGVDDTAQDACTPQ